MLLYFLLLFINYFFNVESLPIGEEHLRMRRFARIETGGDGWLVFNVGLWNWMYVFTWWYLGITLIIYFLTRCYISCCGVVALAVATELNTKKFDVNVHDIAGSEVVHSIRIRVRSSGSEITPPTAKEISNKGILTTQSASDKVILVPQIRQKLFTCREMSRRTIREAAGSKRKSNPMKTALGGKKSSVQMGIKTAIGSSSRIGSKRSKTSGGSGRSTHSGTISGSSKHSTTISSSSGSSSSSESAGHTVSSTRSSTKRSMKSSRSGKSKRSSKRSSRGGHSSRKSSSRSSGHSHK